HCYCRSFDPPLRGETLSPNGKSGDLLPKLSAANKTAERWDYGWRVAQFTANGMVYATKGGQSRIFSVGHLLSLDHPGSTPQPGGLVCALLAREDIISQPGFYCVQPQLSPSQDDHYSFIRFYWHITPEIAPTLVTEVTERCNRYGVPYSFKCLRYPAAYTRADAAVLYVGRRYLFLVLQLVEEIYQVVKDGLESRVPLFSKALGPGLGAAEDPASAGESFGLARCRAMAEAVWNAYGKRMQSEKARLAELAAAFTNNGWDLDKPHLSMGTEDPFPEHFCDRHYGNAASGFAK
ncbi:MAG: hypothetical protein JOZ22_14125, partial [Acidobacteriia bacterium]|nr:hypothetical protein [Terriglobia bacterium]